jgi:hypothetical protein
MKLSIWPKREPLSLARFICVLGLFFVTIYFTVALVRFNPSPSVDFIFTLFAARTFETLTGTPAAADARVLKSNSQYAQSLGNQIKLAGAVGKFFELKGAIPRSFLEMRQAGFGGFEEVDPWHRPYVVRALPPDHLVVQSMGPSGIDRIPWNEPQNLKRLTVMRYRLIGDNLVVVRHVRSSNK